MPGFTTSSHDRELSTVISQINKTAKAMKDSQWDREQLMKLRRNTPA